VPVRGAKAKAAKGKGGKSAKPVLEVETDAKKVNISISKSRILPTYIYFETLVGHRVTV